MASGGRLILRIFILSLIFFLGGSVFSFYSLFYEQNDIPDATVILVEKGENLHQIALRLKRDNLLSSVAVFKAAARFLGKSTSLKAGEYRIPAYASPKEILDIFSFPCCLISSFKILATKRSSVMVKKQGISKP